MGRAHQGSPAKIVGNNEDALARIMRAAHGMAEEITARQKQQKL
jgi:hypothetical protein